jgi:hypothetical protein
MQTLAARNEGGCDAVFPKAQRHKTGNLQFSNSDVSKSVTACRQAAFFGDDRKCTEEMP